MFSWFGKGYNLHLEALMINSWKTEKSYLQRNSMSIIYHPLAHGEHIWWQTISFSYKT